LKSDQRFDYLVLGEDANLASRLEGQTKTYPAGQHDRQAWEDWYSTLSEGEYKKGLEVLNNGDLSPMAARIERKINVNEKPTDFVRGA